MNKNETLVSQIKAFFAVDDVPDAQTFVDVKTSDGLVLRVDAIEEGNTVTIITEDGENVSGEAEYILEDDTTIAVDENGVITSVTPVEDEGEDEPTPAETELAAQVAKDEALNARLANMEEALLLVVSQFSEHKTTTEAFMKLPAEDDEIDAGKAVIVKHSKVDAATKLAKFISESRKK